MVNDRSKKIRAQLTKKKKDAIRKCVNYECEICSDDGYTLEIHHIGKVEYTEGKGLVSEMDIIALCPNCHTAAHNNNPDKEILRIGVLKTAVSENRSPKTKSCIIKALSGDEDGEADNIEVDSGYGGGSVGRTLRTIDHSRERTAREIEKSARAAGKVIDDSSKNINKIIGRSKI